MVDDTSVVVVHLGAGDVDTLAAVDTHAVVVGEAAVETVVYLSTRSADA